jgi:NDP-sugar pyrophosphorylase family protein
VLWDDVTVESGASLRDCIVADGVTIAGGETFERQAIVMDEDRRVIERL